MIEENNPKKLNALLEAALDAIVTIDASGTIRSANHATELMFGYKVQDMLGNNIAMLIPEKLAGKHGTHIHQPQLPGENSIFGIDREMEGVRHDGSVFPLHLSVGHYMDEGAPFYVGILHDLTDQKVAEKALFRAQKMDAIGQLTGGIAHDFNNLLTIITGNLELLAMQLENKAQLDLLNDAQEAAGMGADLTERLLAFAKRSLLEPKAVAINALLEQLSVMLDRSLGTGIRLELQLAQDLWSARVDPGQLENAMINLAINARDAMGGNGRLAVQTQNEYVDADYAKSEPGLHSGDYVRISVTDNGGGMSQDVLEKIFEPFFSTKEQGKGTGLGLSMVYGFAKQSRGHVTVYSEAGIGTTFNLYLPREHGGSEAGKREAADDAMMPLGNGQTVLVVEDDLRVQRLSMQRLEALGYRTLVADDADSALQTFNKNEGIDLVFTDLVMPGGMSGYELATRLREKQPNVRILLTSGYAEDLLHGEKLAQSGMRLLRKPYKQSALAREIRRALEG